MRKVLEGILMGLAAAILLPGLAIAALALYDAPADTRNTVILWIVGMVLAGGAALLIGGGKKHE